jgi:LCP family protein required for cell wall assembly
MENYRRPASPTRGARHDVEGATPTKTKIADQTTQPYRRSVLQQQQTAAPTRPKMPPIDMDLPDGDSFNRHHMQPRIKKQVRRARVVFMRTAFASMALLIGLGGLLFSQGFLNMRKVFKGTAEQAASLQETVDPNQLKGEGDGRINLLLTGIGGEKHAGGNLTDTLMLASIDPVNHTAALLSVPRDMWVTIPGKGSMKINAAYATAKQAYERKNNVKDSDSKATEAGFTSIDQTIEKVLGVPVHYNLLVNFQAFRQAVDTVGGVTIDVPEDLYDPTMAWENNKNPYLARAGEQHFDGIHALIYARSRETSSDFARGERQRAVLLALKEKAVTAGVIANPAKLSKLMGAFGNNVQTDLGLGDASRLYSIVKKINNSNIKSVSLAGSAGATSSAAAADGLVTTGNINGQSIVMPKAGLENYDAIQDYVRSQLQDGYILKENAKILVVNGTVQAGLAQSWATKLKSYGYNVTGTASTDSKVFPTTKIIDLSKNKKKFTKHYLEQRFSETATTSLPDKTIQTGTADFVIILGSDETGTN